MPFFKDSSILFTGVLYSLTLLSLAFSLSLSSTCFSSLKSFSNLVAIEIAGRHLYLEVFLIYLLLLSIISLIILFIYISKNKINYKFIQSNDEEGEEEEEEEEESDSDYNSSVYGGDLKKDDFIEIPQQQSQLPQQQNLLKQTEGQLDQQQTINNHRTNQQEQILIQQPSQQQEQIELPWQPQQQQQNLKSEKNSPPVSFSSNDINFYIRIGALVCATGYLIKLGFHLALLYNKDNNDNNNININNNNDNNNNKNISNNNTIVGEDIKHFFSSFSVFSFFKCINILDVVSSILLIIFILLQSFFVFKNHRVVIKNKVTFFRYCLIHLLSTNLSLIIISMVKETELLTIFNVSGSLLKSGTNSWTSTLSDIISSNGSINQTDYDYNLNSCYSTHILSFKSSPYLFPCSIQFLLICSFALFKLYYQVGSYWPKKIFKFKLKKSEKNGGLEEEEKRLVPNTGFDCNKSHKGMFLGLLVLVFSLVMMSCFFVYINKTPSVIQKQVEHQNILEEGNLSMEKMEEEVKREEQRLDHLHGFYFFYSLEYILFFLSSMASLVGILKFNKLTTVRIQASKFFSVEKAILITCYPGLAIVLIFYFLATTDGIIFRWTNRESFKLTVEDLKGFFTITSCVAGIWNGILQTRFIIRALRKVAISEKERKNKHGRSLVAFLIFCNLSLLVMAVFEHERIFFSALFSPFYFSSTWKIASFLALPFLIFFRFCCTACLAGIWKSSYSYS